jgi:hypothetical protein
VAGGVAATGAETAVAARRHSRRARHAGARRLASRFRASSAISREMPEALVVARVRRDTAAVDLRSGAAARGDPCPGPRPRVTLSGMIDTAART